MIYIQVHKLMIWYKHVHTYLYHVQTRMYSLPYPVQVGRIPDELELEGPSLCELLSAGLPAMIV